MFTPRTTKPSKNKYYITKSKGGYSLAIQGKPTDKDANVLSNCVGYAYGRFHEIANDSTMSLLKPVNAELFMKYASPKCSVGSTPKLGACMVWQKGSSQGSDGAGHVAIVEQIISENEVVTSESGWNSKAFWNQKRKKGSDGNWGQPATYKFLGFIYNPKVEDDEPINVTVEYLNSLFTVHCIVKNGENYIKLVELESVLHICGVVWFNNGVILNGKTFDTSKYNVIQHNGNNYIRLRDLETLKIAKIDYNSNTKRPVIEAYENK